MKSRRQNLKKANKKSHWRSDMKRLFTPNKKEAKIKFLKRWLPLARVIYSNCFLKADRAFYTVRQFGEVARHALGYSKATYWKDILYSLEKVYKEMVADE